MKIVVSSPWTFVFKWIVPAFWAGLWSYLTASLFLGEATATFNVHLWSWYIVKDQPVSWGKWAALGCLVAGGMLFGAVAVPLKRVAVEGDHLLVSNYRREVSVPFSDVLAGGLTGGEISDSPVVELVFRSTTPFGKSISFVPASRETLSLLRARLRPELGAEVDPESEAIAAELHGRGTV
ncbi:MAG TPA: hypothetical protein VMN82_14685 [Thermoanaerobaculia bacterium]|nr:hypothetical protein [Thermoanaerobaculia bacterium]